MKMKVLTILVAFSISGLVSKAATPAKADFYAHNADGSVKTHGIYQTNEQGQVQKYTVFDGAGQLIYTEVPYYADDGRILRADHFDAAGNLQKVVIYFDSFAKVLNAQGEVIDTQVFSQKAFLERVR